MFPSLYAILDPALIAGRIGTVAEKLAAGGATLMQLRDKTSTSAGLFQTAAELNAILKPRNVQFIMNDRPDLAAIVGAAGVHVGQEDLTVEQARKIVGSGAWVGVSTHNLEQLREADRSSADYIAVGPIFRTASKANPDPVVGIEFLKQARNLTRKPLVAIGGITVESCEAAFRAGADSVAVISDLLAAKDIAARAGEYLQIAARVRKQRG